MNYFTKTWLITILSIASTGSSCKKSRAGKRLTGNPYIDRKTSVKEDKRILAKQNKAYAEQLEKNKKDIKKNNDRFFKKKKQYKHITRNRRRVKKLSTRGQF
jgi:hypothetical protein